VHGFRARSRPGHPGIVSRAAAFIVSANLERRNLTKGQQAIALAMIYPDPGKGGRGKKGDAANSLVSGGFSRQRLDQARTVLRHSRAYAEDVLAARTSLDIVLRKVEEERLASQSVDAKMAELRARIRSRSNSASPPSTVSISRPCAVVVSAQASPKERNPALLPVIAASVFSRSRVDRASRSSRVTISTSPASSAAMAFQSCARSKRFRPASIQRTSTGCAAFTATPPVTAVRGQPGFGSKLVHRSFTRQLGGPSHSPGRRRGCS
jgi:hypothetical protein